MAQVDVQWPTEDEDFDAKSNDSEKKNEEVEDTSTDSDAGEVKGDSQDAENATEENEDNQDKANDHEGEDTDPADESDQSHDSENNDHESESEDADNSDSSVDKPDDTETESQPEPESKPETDPEKETETKSEGDEKPINESEPSAEEQPDESQSSDVAEASDEDDGKDETPEEKEAEEIAKEVDSPEAATVISPQLTASSEDSSATQPAIANDKKGISSMPSVPKASKNMMRLVFEAILVIAVIGLGLWCWSLNSDRKDLQTQVANLNNNPQTAIQRQNQILINQVGKLMQLPKNETPTIAEVSNVTQAREQSAFFDNAQNGDKVLLYVKAGEAVLYRPSTNKIIKVAPLTFNNSSTTTSNGTASSNSSSTK